jgi:hypothetical protein
MGDVIVLDDWRWQRLDGIAADVLRGVFSSTGRCTEARREGSAASAVRRIKRAEGIHCPAPMGIRTGR